MVLSNVFENGHSTKNPTEILEGEIFSEVLLRHGDYMLLTSMGVWCVLRSEVHRAALKRPRR